MEERKLHYKMYKDGKKIVFAAIATFSILVAGRVSTVEVHADTVSENTSAATASSTSDMKSAAPSTATTAASRPVSADVIAASTSSSAVQAGTTSASSSSAVQADATSASSSSAMKADATSASSSSAVKANTTNASSSSAVKADTTSVSSSSAVKADTTSASSSSAMKADATSASSSSAVKADATSASSSSAVKADTNNASSSSAVKADTTSASSSEAKPETAHSIKAPQTVTKVSYNTLLQQLRTSKTLVADSDALEHVTKDNFLNYFTLNGSATYDANTGIVTLTPNENNKVGNFSLTSKIDMNTSFTLKGQVNLGSDPNGADGIGFAFHNGNTTDFGNAGGNLGIGGLPDALGFKLDTWHNYYQAPESDKNGIDVLPTDTNGFGYSADTMNAPYGTFVKTTNQEMWNKYHSKQVQRWWAEDIKGTSQALNKNDVNGQFHDFVVNYDGTTRQLTISYTETSGKNLTWITTVASSYQAMAMIVSASTGGVKNLQQFKINSFDFQQAATVNVKYVDTEGNQIAQGEVSYPEGANVNGTYSTEQLTIPNYTFVKMGDGSLPVSGTLTKAGIIGTVIYVYAPAYTATTKTVNETINYVDQDGNPVAPSYTAQPITFLTVTNPVTGSSVTYYSTATTGSTIDKETGLPVNSNWVVATSTDFKEVVNPEVKGYTVASNDAPNSDLTNVAPQTVDNNSNDLNFTVVYTKNASTVTTEKKTVNESIHYVYKDGTTAHDTYMATPVEFTRTVSTDAVTGEKTYGAWSADQSFATVTSPAIKGYTPDQPEITAQTVTGDASNLDFTVTYTPNQETAKVTYIDDTTGKTLSAKDLTGDYGSTDPYRTGDTIADYEKQGYQLVSDNYPTDGVVYNQDGTVQSFTVHLTHGTTPVGPDNPQTPGTPINPDNPNGPKWPEGTDTSSVTQTVTRTVNYLDKQTGKVVAEQVTEQVTYNRTAIVDKVTGQIIGYSTTGGDTVDQTDGDKAWTAVDNKAAWDSVTSPDLSSKGYLAPDLATVAQQTVNPGDKDATVNVYYDHAVVPVNPMHPQTPGTPINPDDPDSPKWPAGTDKDSLTTDIHQTIHYQYGDGSQAAPDKTDSTTFEHQVEIDKVTGEIVKDDGWTAENGKTSFDSKTSPVIPGYTASKPASDPVDGLTQNSKDNVQTIVYTPNKETAKVTYIDDTTGKTLSAKDLTGDYGSTDPYRTGDTIADYEKQGYQLVSDNYPTDGVVYNQDGTVQSFEVHLTHGTTPVGPDKPQTPGEPINPDNPDGPKWPEGTDKSSVTQTVTRTVNYLDKQTGKVVAKQVTEQVTYNRTAIVDKVTGQIIGYSTTGGDTVDQTDGDKAWTAVDNKAAWDSVTSPDLSSKGYLAPDLATVAQQTVNPGDKDATVNVYYDHAVVPVNPMHPQTPGTPINPDDPDSPKWPAGTDKDSLTTDIHQTIHYQYGDGSQAAPDKTDSTTFEHQVEIDKVTGEIVKDDGWTAENGKTSFDSKTSPVITGYTASKPASDPVDGLTQNSKDNVQTIVYTPDQETAKVTYIDDTTGKTLSAKDLTGDYGSTDPYRTGDTIADYEKQGYQLVSDNYPTDGVVYNQDGTVQSFEVHLTHGTTPVGPDKPQTPGEPINPDNPDGPKWPEGTDKSSVTQTITRTVNYLDKQTGKVVAKQVTEQVTYNRTAIVDKVTGQIIGYSTTGGDTVDQTDGDKAWTAVDNKAAWDSVTSPDLSSKGYLAPDLATVAQQTVNPGDKDATVNVYYDHAVVPVNPMHPQTPGTPINPDDPDSPKWPAGTDKDSLTTDIHQTIHYQYGDGSQAAPDKTDSTTFEHQVEIDKVTGEIVKDDGWTAENGKTSFDSKTSPVITGYTASKPASDPVDGLTQNSKDNVQTIVYTPNKETAKVTYIDDTTGKTLSAKDLTGDYGSTDPYRTGDTIADYEKQGYQLVSDNYPTDGVVYNQDGTVQSFEVHLTHGTTPVGPDKPQTPGEPINPDNPDGPKWPEGTDKSSVTQTVTRTVNYLDKQTGKVVAKQVTEQVTYNRTAIVDKVTGQIIGYSTTGGDTVDQTDGDKAWTAVDNKAAWDSVTSPDLSSKGYLAPDLATVAQQTVNPGDKDATVNVYYDHAVVPVNPMHPQTPGTPINPDDPDSPKWPAGTDKDSLTTDIHQTIHYQYGDGSQAAPDKNDSTTFTHQVEIDKVTGEVVKDDGWTAENGKTSFDSKTSPVIPGYTASKPASDPVDGLTQNSKDDVQTIVYAPNQETAKVTYIDDTTGKTLSAKDLTGDYGSTDPYRTGDTIADYEKQGYQLVSDNYPTDGVVYNQDGTVQSFEVHLTHGTTPVGPDKPQTPGEPINPDNPDGPKWPEGTDTSSVTQTVTRTVNYLDKQTGKVVAKQVTEQVTYNRTAIVDKVTGQIIGYSTTGGDTVDQTDGDKAWTAVDNKAAWDSVTSPDLSSKGYLAPDLATVAQQTVNPGDKDATVNVYYDHAVVPVNPMHPQTPGTPINPDDPDSPKWPAGTDKDSLTTDIHQTIHYQYGDGSQAAPDKTDSTTFEHQVEIDKVTGEVVKDDGWTAENGKTSFDSKTSPVITGYTASKPASDSVDGLTQNSKDDVQTIVYTKDPVAGGNVTAKYVDENGNPIADNVVSSGNVGDPYSTTQKDVPGYTLKEVQGNPTGSFTDQDQTVTYVYTKDPVAGGNVTAKYVDENGNPIADNVVSSGNVGDPYSTTQKDVPGYTFKEVQGDPTGSFTDQAQTVTYVYTKNPVAGGNVTAKYVDENGNPIADDVVSSGNVGDPYSTTQKDVPGYTFKEVQGDPTGSFTDQAQTVTYVYTKNPVAGGNVTAKYVDENGNPIADDVVSSGNVGDPYSTTQKDVPGYTFKEVQGDPTGSFTDQAQTVTYVYTKNPVAGGNVTAKYVDENGNPIADDVVSSGNVGDPYSTTQKDVPGYTFKEVQGDPTGSFTDQAQTVTYVYTKNPVAGGNVTAKYVDENGNPIADDVVSSGNVGDPYSTTQKDIPGYTLKEVQGNPTGSFTDQDQTVTYVYTKNPATDNNGGTGSDQPGNPDNGTDTGNPSSNQPGNPSQPSNTTNNGVINTSTNTGSKVNNGVVSSPKLPQTGEKNSQSQTMSFVGILLAMFGGLLGFLGIKKRRND